jgi:hypothetical protein
MNPMTKIYQEAHKQAQDELHEAEVKKFKNFILNTLQKIEDKKREQDKITQEIRALKADLEDLKAGNLKKIKERQEKDEVARQISAVKFNEISNGWKSFAYSSVTNSTGGNWWFSDIFSDTYLTSNHTFYF